jgi:hypothetical protein
VKTIRKLTTIRPIGPVLVSSLAMLTTPVFYHVDASPVMWKTKHNLLLET